ncbi:leucine-rich repeat flightless-interacting protein 2-like isoform X9 [Xyrauchen texanus]|uniref:leucine-rich repeat flightless-interacting protein 2-like isoform X9 n=1 Tax=Xyrauchen texanus TaxID=154827 RepID=UPI00224210A4|nr:leucine-rich repeat flightless-interacting protein 2-like isoform X9 [Xyrauchen texanus]
MGTPGSGRKRTPIKNRFSAEDEALSSIAREAEARLAAKRAARAEARDIRMKELERQQKEADAEKARHGHHSSSHSRRGLNDDTASVRSVGSYRSNSSSLRDLSSSHHSSRASSSRRRDLVSGISSSSSLKSSYSTSSVYNDLHKKPVGNSSKKDLLTGLYHDQRNYSSLKTPKPPPSTVSTYTPRAPSSSSSTVLMRSCSVASICDDGLYGSYSSRAPSECSWYSSGASSTRSSPVSSDDDSSSSVSQSRRGRRDSVLADFSETAADYFSRSNRRGSIVSDVDDLSIPDLDSMDEKCDKQFTDPFSRPSSRCATPALSAAALASLGGSSSRRGSGDTGSVIMDPEASLNELKESLSEVEEKYKKAMVSNAQLDNDKTNLIYQVDTLKDFIEEMEEQMSELRRETEDKSKDLERQKHTCSVLQHKQEELKEGIRQRDELIKENKKIPQKLDTLMREVFDLQETVNWKDKKIAALERQKEYFDCIRNERDELRNELADLKGKSRMGEEHGLVIIPEDMPNGDVNHESPSSGITVVTQEAAQVLESAGDGPLDVRLRKLADEKNELLAQIRKLKIHLDEERQKHTKIDSVYKEEERMENGTDLQFIEMQRDSNRQISEYKFKLSKTEQEMATMEQNINRLEGQVSRYKSASDNAEKVEDELKAEKRKLQRELRTALDKIEEMEMTNNHLVKRLEKMKANRNALLSQQ